MWGSTQCPPRLEQQTKSEFRWCLIILMPTASQLPKVLSLFAACTKPMMTCNSSNCFSMGKSKLEFRCKLDHVRMQVGGSERTKFVLNLGHEVPLNSINQLLPGRIRTCILFSNCRIKHNWDS